QQRHRRDFARPVAVGAALIKDGGDIPGERGRVDGGRRRRGLWRPLPGGHESGQPYSCRHGEQSLTHTLPLVCELWALGVSSMVRAAPVEVKARNARPAHCTYGPHQREVADYFFRPALRLRGTLAPARRASLNPIAIACLRLVTFFPERPDRSVPCLRSRITRSTFFDAFGPYLRLPRRFFAIHHLIRRRPRASVVPSVALECVAGISGCKGGIK